MDKSEKNDEFRKLIWAKTNPFKSLISHLIETACVMEELLTCSAYKNDLKMIAEWLSVSEEEALALCKYLASIHDIGKCHPLFQKQYDVFSAWLECNKDFDLIYSNNNSIYRHEIGSCVIAQRIWKDNSIFGRIQRNNFSRILSIHHQGKDGDDVPLTNSHWIDEQNRIELLMRGRFNPPKIPDNDVKHTEAVCILITGFLILSDWIASSSFLSGEQDENEVKKSVQSFICKAGLNSSQIGGISDYNQLFPWITSENERPLQKTVKNTVQEQHDSPIIMMMIEAPMGEGKTEAGLLAASIIAESLNKSGFYVGLPTAATSNQMILRVNNMLEHINCKDAKLLHSMAWLDDIGKSESSDYNEAESWLNPSKRALLSQFAVGTVDQAMMAAIRVKYGVLRLLGLTDKVLIIDEIHAYDAYMSTILERLFEWCRELQIPVIMLSATLPKIKKKSFLDIYGCYRDNINEDKYPILTVARKNGHVYSVPVNGTFQNMNVKVTFIRNNSIFDAVTDIISKISKDGGCICILVNTVSTAQNMYRIIKSSFDIPTYLFHSRFSSARRKEIENECLEMFGQNSKNRPERAILIATQVVEQSLDIDFDGMITEIAPIDLVLQRMGRLHRHRGRVRPSLLSQPQLFVVSPENDLYGDTEKVYFKNTLDRSSEVLSHIDSLSVPDDIPKLVNTVYSDTVTESEIDSWIEKQMTEDMNVGKAKNILLQNKPSREFVLGSRGTDFYDDGEKFIVGKTRLSNDSLRIAVVPNNLFECVKKIINREGSIPSDVAEQVMLYSVSIPGGCSKVIEDADFITGNGKLYGIKIMQCCEDNPKPQDTLTAQIKDKAVVIDREYGFEIKERC